MTRFVALCLALMGCAPDDITIVADPNTPDSYLEALDTCVELWTPLAPMAIDWQIGRNYVPSGGIVLKVLPASEMPGRLGYYCDGPGCLPEIGIRKNQDPWWAQRVLCHEIGHAIGFGPEHNCPDGSLMGVNRGDRSKWVNVPGKCEAQRLGVEL